MTMFNTLSNERCGSNFKSFKLVIKNSSLGTYYKNDLTWLPQNLTYQM